MARFIAYSSSCTTTELSKLLTSCLSTTFGFTFIYFGWLRLKLMINEINVIDIVHFPFLDDDVPRLTSYGVYVSQLIRFARVSSHFDDFNTGNKVLTAKLLRHGYRYDKIRKTFLKCYRRYFGLVSKYNVELKTLPLQSLSEPEIYGDLVYKFRKIIGEYNFPYHFKKIIVCYKKIGYNIDSLRQTACLVVNPIKVNNFDYLFDCTTVGRASD